MSSDLYAAFTTGEILCEIINPSDPYTLRTDDFVAAAMAIAILGDGQLGLRTVDDSQSTPVLFGWPGWMEANGVDDDYVGRHLDAIIAALDSVMIGNCSDRRDAESFLSKLPEDKRREWLEERHDRRRSSMNDIGGAAWCLAEHLRSRLASASVDQTEEPSA